MATLPREVRKVIFQQCYSYPLPNIAKCRGTMQCRLVSSTWMEIQFPPLFATNIPRSHEWGYKKIMICSIVLPPLAEWWRHACIFNSLMYSLQRNSVLLLSQRVWLLCRSLFPPHKHELLTQILEMAEIHRDSRSYALSVEDFGRLCIAYQKLCTEYPGLLEYDFRYNKIQLPPSDSVSSDN